jgi:hypothetical protein
MVIFAGSMAFTRKNLGIMFFGGGTGARVVDIELDPVTEYEYLLDAVKFTCEVTEPEANRKSAEAVTWTPTSSVFDDSWVLVIDIFTSMVELVKA